jgi:hypothetical protein
MGDRGSYSSDGRGRDYDRRGDYKYAQQS